MYHHLRGELRELQPALAVLEAGGVGFEVKIPLSTYERLKGKADALLYTHLHVREDELKLFGFATRAERELFRLLLGVSGVGPTTALQALSASSPDELSLSIASGDLKSLQRMKGIGKKLAERLVVELRDKVASPGSGGGGLAGALPVSPGGATAARPALFERPEVNDAILALVSLGFERKSAEDRVLQVHAALSSREAAPPAERLIRECLRYS